MAITALRASAAPDRPNMLSPGIHDNIRLSQYPSIAEAPQVVSRILSPLAVEEIRRKLHASRKALQAEMFDTKNEEFVIYVPRYKPAEGYGLLVFIPPWPHLEIPPGWSAVLDHFGVIFVSAARSGNEAEILERRIPLALAGLANVQAMFSINPERTLIGGFSGGSRVALRVALAYPDIFGGVLLNAGSDPIGQSPNHLSSPKLFLTFQTKTRIAYVTGQADAGNQSIDTFSQSSMLHWCVSNTSIQEDRGVGHEVASAAALDRALAFLFASPKPDTGALAACRAARQQEVSSAISGLSALLRTVIGPRLEERCLKSTRNMAALPRLNR